MTVQNSAITDGWTRSEGYARVLQSQDQIDQVLKLLRLESSRAFADIGCGNGAFAVPAATSHPQCTVFAYDSLESAITECRRRAADAGAINLTAGIASADSIPLGTDDVDRVLSRNVLHHLKDAAKAYDEVLRITAPGGLFLLEAPFNSGPAAVGQVLTDLFRLKDESHVRQYHSEGAIVDALHARGFHVAERSTWLLTNRTPPGGAELVEAAGATEHLQVKTDADDIVTYELPMIRLVARLKP